MTGLITDPLSFWAKTRPDEAAIVFGERSVNFAELHRWTDGVAGHLAGLGLRPGEVVSISGANSIEWIAAALGAIKAGAVLAPLNERSVASEFAGMLETVEPRFIFADDARAELIAPLQPGHGFSLLRLEDVADVAATEFVPPAIDAGQPALLVFTSGSTGRPKAVIHTHATILAAHFERQLIEPAYTQGMRQLFMFSLYAIPGTVWGFMSTCIHGGLFVMEPGFDPVRGLALLVEHRISVFVGVPILFEQISKVDGFDQADLSALASVHVGGAPMPEALLDRWRRKGVLCRQLYGLTEVCGGATVSTDEEVRAGLPTCGRGGVFTRVRVVDDGGCDCPAGEAGHILVKGPACTPGYWRNPAATEALYADGWLKTGDIGSLDEQGRLRFIDRAKDILITGGINISPAEIERVIAAAPGVREVAVIAAVDEKFGETPAAILVADQDFSAESCVAHCSQHLSAYKVPRYLIPISNPLPRLASGKIDKPRLRTEFADVHLRYARVR